MNTIDANEGTLKKGKNSEYENYADWGVSANAEVMIHTLYWEL